jgi:5-(carboxyamino)imidazole ribonucleotide mutase
LPAKQRLGGNSYQVSGTQFKSAEKRLCNLLRRREKGTDCSMPKTKTSPALVSVVMGSASDWETMQHCVALLDGLGVPNEYRIVSAHRTPDLMARFACEAAERGVQVIIAGAGGAAHLPGMIAAQTWLPVLGVPVESRALKGLDSLLSIAQMPAGVAVGTLAIGKAGAKNAALLAASIVGLHDAKVKAAVQQFRARQTKSVLAQKLP